MADLRPTTPSAHMESESTVLATRPGSPADTLQNTINEKDELKKSASNNAATRVTSKTDTTNVDPEANGDVSDRYIEGYKLWLVHSGFLAAVLLFALDQTIVSTALPVLASKFNALDNLTWVVSAYFLTQAGLMLTFGQILTITSNKYVFIVCISLFEIGSLICGVAPSMNVLIFGRAFQGVGASGQFISILTLLSQVARLEIRPLLFGTFGGVFALASVIGPLLGGVFTDRVSWRWCFYINLPFGGVALFLVWWFLPNHPPLPNPLYTGMTRTQRWLALDWIGSILSLSMITCLLLPLQWGGNTRPWNDRVVIALFCTFGVLLIMFVAWEYHKGERAMLPLNLFRRRTQVGASGATFFMMIGFLTASYYLPFFYQAKGRTAQQSGIDIIPFMLGAVLASFGSGALVNGTGHYLTWLIIGPLISAVGAGLMFTIDETTKNAKIIGFQIIFGFGLGLAFQLPVMAIQAEYADKPEQIPQASSLLTFFQLLGGVIGIAIAGTIFNNQLGTNLKSLATPLDPATLTAVKQSVTIIFTLPKDQQAPVVHAYVKALDYVFILSVPVSAITSIVALLIKNWNTKQRSAGGTAAVAV